MKVNLLFLRFSESFFVLLVLTAVINDLLNCEYLEARQEKVFYRTIIYLIILDLLKQLKNHEAVFRLHILAEVPVSVHAKHAYGSDDLIRGRADWGAGIWSYQKRYRRYPPHDRGQTT